MKKKKLIASYLHGILDFSHGESYWSIFKYFLPELITNTVVYALPFLIDSYFIGQLKSTASYTTLGVTNTMLHMIIKLGEGFSVGGLVLAGHYNGQKKSKEAGGVLSDLFWSTFIIGVVISLMLFFGAHLIYKLHGVPEEMIELGVPFLRLRALGVFFMFLYFAFVGFLRGIKNTKAPMIIFIIGGVVLISFDYLLVFGNFGFPEMRLQGSAVATVLQYGIMLLIASAYLFFNKE